MKKCSRCGLIKDKSEFYKRTMKTMISVSSYCKLCSKEHKTQRIKKNRDKVRVNRIWSRYRMRPDDINKILESQGYLCAICGENEPVVRRWSVIGVVCTNRCKEYPSQSIRLAVCGIGITAIKLHESLMGENPYPT